MVEEKIGQDKPIVIGVGASAGGLEAFKTLLKGLPDEHDMVLILVQHLDPDHESLMPELLSAKTRTPVQSVKDGMKIERGHIYLMPPGHELEMDGDILKLVEFSSPRGLRRPIDRFFSSLSTAHGENAVAVILSGTGSDGANGARDVKGQGGLVFVQTPEEAQYDGMPQAVVQQNTADVIVGAAEIIEVVRDYFSLRSQTIESSDERGGFLDRIMRHVRFRTGHDFSEYKEATMRRRVAVRMSVLNIQTPRDYLSYLVETKNEADILFQDLLINVTSFFRDADHFDTLRSMVIPDLIAKTSEHGDLRVWVAGCSTGEEAYSLAILIAEEISRVNKQMNVTIFGTDIDDKALTAARLGRYSDSIAMALPDGMLERYFRHTPDGYEVGPQLREMVRFSRHSFIKDPPFSRLDLVSCRNVLIYVQDPLQELASRVFHYALREGGYLFLGPSENPSAVHKYFVEANARARLFRRRAGQAKPLSLGTLSGAVMKRKAAEQELLGQQEAFTDVERVVLDHFTPAYLHTDADNNLIYSSPNATRYLSLRPGKISTNVFEVIAPELEATFRRVARSNAEINTTAEFEFQGEVNGTTQRAIVSRRRLGDGTILYVLDDNLKLLDSRPGGPTEIGSKQDTYLRQLELELDEAKQAVRTTVEELETSNEELKSSNEEMMSMNEELQSANEELTTINDELQEKLRELHQVNIDLDNFVVSTQVPTVFLSSDLALLRFTPETEAVFSFSDADLGRPLKDLNARIDQKRLLELCEQSVEDQIERQEEFRTDDKSVIYRVRIMPFSPDGERERGVVFTFQDITQLREAIETAQTAKAEAEAQSHEVNQIYAKSPLAMGLIGRDMRYIRLNQKLADINGVPIAAHLGKTVREVIPDVAEQTEDLIRRVLDTGIAITGIRVTGSTIVDPSTQHVWESDWVPFSIDDDVVAVSVTVRDITEQVTTSDNLREIMRELEHRVKNMLSNVKALVNRAARDATTDAAVFETLNKRIQGLSQTHSLLTAEAWSSALLDQLFRLETIDVYGEDRITLSGPTVRISSEATLSIGMAIHELATNAAKYGALSAGGGHVGVTWTRIADARSDRLVIEWVETGGPEVTEPSRSGFGTRLIASTIEGNIEGKVSHFWEPSGLRVVIELDYDAVSVAVQD